MKRIFGEFLNMNENFSTIHEANALHYLHSVPCGSETVSMRFSGVKNPSELQKKQISMKGREVAMDGVKRK